MAGDNLVTRVIQGIANNTFAYTPNPATLEENKTKALYGTAAIIGGTILPGDHPFIVTTAMVYTALKCYHAVRDWAGK